MRFRPPFFFIRRTHLITDSQAKVFPNSVSNLTIYSKFEVWMSAVNHIAGSQIRILSVKSFQQCILKALGDTVYLFVFSVWFERQRESLKVIAFDLSLFQLTSCCENWRTAKYSAASFDSPPHIQQQVLTVRHIFSSKFWLIAIYELPLQHKYILLRARFDLLLC
jgi:hypothetical protein